MYTLYIPKYQGDVLPYNITKVIRTYMKTIDYNCIILASPGFMGTNDSSIGEFVNKFDIDLRSSSKELTYGLFYGMNGRTKISSGTPLIYDTELNKMKIKGYKILDIDCKSIKDHRKMIFFLKIINSFKNKLTNANIDDFLKTVEVQSILIGSTNQSPMSYYGIKTTKKGIVIGNADKGEADIFMFTEKEYADDITNNGLSDVCVLSKSISVPGSDDKAFLKKVLKDFLSNSTK